MYQLRNLVNIISSRIKNKMTDELTDLISKMENLQKLWAEAALKSIESKQINVERSFVDFEEFWNVTTPSPAVSVVFDDLEPDLVMEIRSSVKKELQPDASGKIICEAHANTIKGIV